MQEEDNRGCLKKSLKDSHKVIPLGQGTQNHSGVAF